MVSKSVKIRLIYITKTNWLSIKQITNAKEKKSVKIPKPRRRYVSIGNVTRRSRYEPRPRRIRIDPSTKRELFIYETDKTKAAIQKIIDDPETPDKIRIQAANCYANLIRVSYQMVRDIDIEDVERQIEELEDEFNKQRDNDLDFSPQADSTHTEDEEQKQPSKTTTTVGAT